MASSQGYLRKTDLENIYQQINPSRVLVVNAPTATGKTRFIPPYLLTRMKKTVFVAVPTREAARTISTSVSLDNPKMKVGYAAAGEIAYDMSYKGNQLVYMTSGHLKNLILKGRIANPENVLLIVDEVHTGTTDNSIILSIWKESRESQLMLMSATTKDLELPFEVDMLTLDIKRNFNIDYSYVDTSLSSLYPEMANQIIKHHNTNMKGHFLSFVPGVREANRLADQIKKTITSKVLVLIMHSGQSKEDIKDVFSEPKGGIRKIIVATNVAESSITVPNISLVIDSCRENIMVASMLKNNGIDTNYEASRLRTTAIRRLEETYITKMSAIQRAGRTGRTIDGICVRMLSEDKYISLDNTRKPEIERIPIHKEILELYMAGFTPDILPKSIHNKLRVEVKDLMMMKMLEIIDKELVVTNLGKFSGSVTLNTRPATFLYTWIKKGYSCYWGAVIASILEGNMTNIFHFPKDVDVEKHKRTYFNKYNLPDHLSSVFSVWMDFENYTNGDIKRKRNQYNVTKWCKKNSFSYYSLKETIETIIRVMSIIYNMLDKDPDLANDLNLTREKILEINGVSVLTLLQLSVPILSEVYSDRILKKKGEKYIDMFDSICFINNNIPFEITFDNDLISLDEIESKKIGRVSNRISLSVYATFDPKLYSIDVSFSGISTALTRDRKQRENTQVTLIMPTNYDFLKTTKFIDLPDEGEYFLMDIITPSSLGLTKLTIPIELTPSTLLGGRKFICNPIDRKRKRQILNIPNYISLPEKKSKKIESNSDLEQMELFEEYEEQEEKIYFVDGRSDYTLVEKERHYLPFSFYGFTDKEGEYMEEECNLYLRENYL